MKMNEHLKAFVRHLTEKEKSKSTIESYTRYVSGFLKYMDGNEITKELVIQYREHLESRNLVHTTINLMLVSINCYLEYVQKPECRVKLLKIQKRNYVDARMTEAEYEQLLSYAHTHRETKYYLIMRPSVQLVFGYRNFPCLLWKRYQKIMEISRYETKIRPEPYQFQRI